MSSSKKKEEDVAYDHKARARACEALKKCNTSALVRLFGNDFHCHSKFAEMARLVEEGLSPAEVIEQQLLNYSEVALY